MNRVGITIFLIVLLPFEWLFSQAKRDPRMIGMGGAYTTLADGIYAVGINPANLSFQHDKPFMLQLATLNVGFVNNLISFRNWARYSGADLERNNQEKKREIFDQVGDNLRLTADSYLALPALNYASGNMAITSDLVVVWDIGIPSDILHLILKGNPTDRPLDMSLKYELMGVGEYAFSFAVPYRDVSLGISIKYLQGLFYLGIDPDSSEADLVTDVENAVAFYGNGRYFIRQGVGGAGYGLDLGFSTRELQGWKFGVSLINALGNIYWNRPSLTRDLLGVDEEKGLFSFGGEPVTYGSAMVYEFTIDSLNAINMNEQDQDSIFTSTKRVVRDTTATGEPRRFSTRYPSVFRVGVSKQIEKEIVIASDLVAGFEDRLYVQRQWKWSIGMKFSHFPGFPIRLGFTYGGRNLKEMGLGFGIYKGPLMFDFGFAFRNGIWIHTMKGVSLAMGLTLTGFKSREE